MRSNWNIPNINEKLNALRVTSTYHNINWDCTTTDVSDTINNYIRNTYVISNNEPYINKENITMNNNSTSINNRNNNKIYYDEKSNNIVTEIEKFIKVGYIYNSKNTGVYEKYCKPKQIKSYEDKKNNTRVVKVIFTDDTFTTAICKCNNEEWYDTGVMICLAKRYIGWNAYTKTSAFNKIVDCAMKIEKNRANKEKLDNEKKEAEKLKHKKYIEKKLKRKARRNNRRNNNE